MKRMNYCAVQAELTLYIKPSPNSSGGEGPWLRKGEGDGMSACAWRGEEEGK